MKKVVEGLLLPLLFMGWVLLFAGNYAVEVKTSKNQVELGEKFRITVEVRGNVDCKDVLFPQGSSFGDIVISKEDKCRQTDFGVAKDYEAAAFDLKAKIPELEVMVSNEKYKSLPVNLTIKENLPKDVSKIQPRNDADWWVAPFPWRSLFLILLVLASFIGILAYLLFRKRKDGEDESTSRPYWQICNERLYKLRNSALPELGEFHQFYYLLTEILRFCIEKRFKVDALEMTNSEFIMWLNKTDLLDEKLKMKLCELVERSGPIKYARQSVDVDLCYKDLEVVENLVEMCRKDEEERAEEKSEKNGQ